MTLWPMEFYGDEPTGRMLQRAAVNGTPESEALEETHGMVSLDRAPHQELRKHFGLAYSVASWESGHAEWVDCEAPDD